MHITSGNEDKHEVSRIKALAGDNLGFDSNSKEKRQLIKQ